MSSYREKSDKERDRLTRMKTSDQEKYLEEAMHELNEKGKGEDFFRFIMGGTGKPKGNERRR